jgi:hypothetical protein
MGIEWLKTGGLHRLHRLRADRRVWCSGCASSSSTRSRPTTCGKRSSRSRTGPWPWWWPPCAWASRIIVAAAIHGWLRGCCLPGGLSGQPFARARPRAGPPAPGRVALLASVFVVAACGLLYELAAGRWPRYVLGDSVLQFSTIIGTYLFAMGVGSWLSRFFERQLPAHFLRIELLVALIGGALPALLFLANAWAPGAFRLLLYGWCSWWARWWGWRSRWSCASSSATWRSRTWSRRC